MCDLVEFFGAGGSGRYFAMTELRCLKCNRLLAMQEIDNIIIKHASTVIIISGGQTTIHCGRCGEQVNVAQALTGVLN